MFIVLCFLAGDQPVPGAGTDEEGLRIPDLRPAGVDREHDHRSG